MTAAGRLLLLWFTATITLAAYYEIVLGLQSGNASWAAFPPSGLTAVLVHVTIPVLIAFLFSVWFGLWRRSGPILLRALAAISCVAIPLAGLLLCRVSDPLIAEFLSQP